MTENSAIYNSGTTADGLDDTQQPQGSQETESEKKARGFNEFFFPDASIPPATTTIVINNNTPYTLQFHLVPANFAYGGASYSERYDSTIAPRQVGANGGIITGPHSFSTGASGLVAYSIYDSDWDRACSVYLLVHTPRDSTGPNTALVFFPRKGKQLWPSLDAFNIFKDLGRPDASQSVDGRNLTVIATTESGGDPTATFTFNWE